MSGETSGFRWVSTILKIVFFTGAILLVLFTVMANLGGNSDVLKKSIEEFVSESTSYDASVGRLVNMTFFPDISFDFENMEMSKKTSPDPVIVIDKVQIAFGFWDVMAGTGKIKALNVRGFKVLPGILISNSIMMDFVEIAESVESPHLQGKGFIGDQAVQFTVEMDAHGLGKGKKYNFGREREFEMMLGDVSFKGKMRTGESAGLVFENLDIRTQDKPIASGLIDVVRNADRVDISGNINVEDKDSDIRPDIHIYRGADNAGIQGIVESAAFHVEDFAAGSGYDHLVTVFENMWGKPTEQVPGLTMKIDTLYRGGEPAGSYEGPLPLKGWHIDTKALKAAP